MYSSLRGILNGPGQNCRNQTRESQLGKCNQPAHPPCAAVMAQKPPALINTIYIGNKGNHSLASPRCHQPVQSATKPCEGYSEAPGVNGLHLGSPKFQALKIHNSVCVCVYIRVCVCARVQSFLAPSRK